MIRIFSTLALLCASLLSVTARNVSAQAAHVPMAHVIVQLKGFPLAANPQLKVRNQATHFRLKLDATLPEARWYTNALSDYQTKEIDYLHSLGIDLIPGYRMQAIVNGFTALVPKSQLRRLRAAANIVSVVPQRKILPLIDRSVPLVNAPAAWDALGGGQQAGRGIYIAQIDSGIDIHSPCFSDANMPAPSVGLRADTTKNRALVNNKVVVARAFGTGGPSVKYSAADSEGHGTFGGAIEACDYNTTTPLGTKVSGMAPAAYLMNYNVFPGDDSGSGRYDNLLPAINAAVEDGADVINMSLGFPLGQGVTRLDFDEQGVELAIRAGIPVVVSAGNAGPTPQTVSSPAGDPNTIAVGASTNTHGLYASVDVNGPAPVPSDLQKISSKEGSAAFTQSVGPANIVSAGFGRAPNDDPIDKQANDFAGTDLHGKIALIERGSPTGSPITFRTKVQNATDRGAIGVVIYDNNPSDLNPLTPSVGSARLPTMFIGNSEGKALLAYVQAHQDATVTLDPVVSSHDTVGDLVSDFSSRGYNTDYTIKPDLVAPGENIYSATQTEFPDSDMYSASGFTSEDGTSFSAPHVTGAVALLEQKHLRQANWTPATIKAVLMQTADTSIYTDAAKTQTPSILDMGAGRLDVGAAITAQAYALPQSLSFGGVNDGSGAIHQTNTLSLSDLGGGSGTWQVQVRPLNTASGVSVSAPASVNLTAGGKIAVPIQLDVTQSAAPGSYDGFIYFSHGSQTLHVPYLVHVSSQAVKPQSVLLVDDTTSRFQSGPTGVPVAHVDVTRYYESALTAIGKTYTYWDEAQQGTPTLQNMKLASVVIYYTGSNLNALASQNSNPEELEPPLGPTDVQTLDSYLRQGGRLFLTGMGAAFSDPYWLAIMLGAEATNFSVFDTKVEDKQLKGGLSPPKPSASPQKGSGALASVGAFAGLKSLDFSTKGDGAGTNLAVYNSGIGELVGVAPLAPVSGKVNGYQTYGRVALGTSLIYGYQKVGVVSSDEPNFKHAVSYSGRSVLFSFGFEGINDNTGYATRAQVMQRVLQWLNDKPVARVKVKRFRAGVSSTLTASLSTAAPAKIGAYTWQIGSKTLNMTARPTHYHFPRAGRYRIRVQITDTLGHQAVSPWAKVTVR